MTPAVHVVGVGLPAVQEWDGRESRLFVQCTQQQQRRERRNGTVWTDFFVSAALKRKRGAVGKEFHSKLERGHREREVGNNAPRVAEGG